MEENFLKTTEDLMRLIRDRKKKMPKNSYTASLFKKGKSEIAKKVSEEAIETAIASMENSKKHLVYEAADLWYHLLVLLVSRNISLDEISKELKSRYK